MNKSSLYFLDFYIPNNGEHESAIEVAVLRWEPMDKRPSVYIHSFITPAHPNRIKWKEVLKMGISKEMILERQNPTLLELISSLFLKEKNVVLFNPPVEPYASFSRDALSVQSITSLWSEVFARDEEGSKIDTVSNMLKYLGLEEEDTSDTKYTQLLVRLHSMVAIWYYLTQIKNKQNNINLEIEKCTVWPLKKRDMYLSTFDYNAFDSMSTSAIYTLFSQDLPDYLDWNKLCIYSHDWVFNRKAKPLIEPLNGKLTMANYIYNKVLKGAVRLWVVICYALYDKKLSQARDVALNRSEDLNLLPDSIKEDFTNFIVLHLDDFLSDHQKIAIVRSMVSHTLQDRGDRSFEEFDFDVLYRDYKKNSVDSPYIFNSIAVNSNNHNKCFKEIRDHKMSVLYRRYEVSGDENDRYECLDKVRELFQDFVREVKKPLSSYWISDELQCWLQYFTGFTFEEIKRPPTQNDTPELINVRNTLTEIIKEFGSYYSLELREKLSCIFEELQKSQETHFVRRFVFQGISIEVVFNRNKVSFFKKLLRF